MVYELCLNKTVTAQKGKKENCIGMIYQYINSSVILIWWDLFGKKYEPSTKFSSIQHVFVVHLLNNGVFFWIYLFI